jgi:hypothetical protein
MFCIIKCTNLKFELRVKNNNRKTSLRFHNIQVPLDERGRIVYPVDTDELIPQVCYTTRGLEININDF